VRASPGAYEELDTGGYDPGVLELPHNAVVGPGEG
jgi:hypothetical protein